MVRIFKRISLLLFSICLVVNQLSGQEPAVYFEWPGGEWEEVIKEIKLRANASSEMEIPCINQNEGMRDATSSLTWVTFKLEHSKLMSSVTKDLGRDVSYIQGQTEQGEPLFGFLRKNKVYLYYSRGGIMYSIVPVDDKRGYNVNVLSGNSHGKFDCLSSDISKDIGIRTGGQSVECQVQNYDVLTMKLMVACTGEWGEYFEDKGEAISAILENISALNVFYKKEMNIQFDLQIEDRFIYLEPEKDPFTADIDSLTEEARQFFNDSTRFENYDIGHVYHKLPSPEPRATGAAFIGSACREGEKGAGWTGTVEPSNASLNVKVTAHEIAHSLGAHHTFYGIEGDCGNIGSRHTGHGFEPGGGNSIMGYPGNCNSNNSDGKNPAGIYFHTHTLNEILEYLNFYRACGDRQGFGTVPSVVIPNDFSVPEGSAFELKALGDNSFLYNWEQYDTDFEIPDKESASPLNAGFFKGKPVYRSYPPSSWGQYRSFPANEVVASGNEFNGEVFTRVPRLLTMRMTARKEGYLACRELLVNVVEGDPLEVVSPKADTMFELIDSSISVSDRDFTIPIEWNIGSTRDPGMNYDSVSIYYSTDGGRTFPYLLVENIPNSGVARVIPPRIDTENARIKVSASDAPGQYGIYDISPGDFTVGVSVTPIIIEDFHGELVGESHRLYWSVKDPGNEIFHLVLEKSKNGVDFTALKNVDRWRGTYDNEGYTREKIFYRLAVRLFSGKIHYSKVVALKGKVDGFEKPFVVSPNPVSGEGSKVHFNSDLPCFGGSLYLMDQFGKVVWRFEVGQAKKSIALPGNLLSGMYFLVLQCDGKRFVEKLIVT